MKAKTLYGIYEAALKNKDNDLIIGLAQYKADQPEEPISYEKDKAIRDFIDRHGQKLAQVLAAGPEAGGRLRG